MFLLCFVTKPRTAHDGTTQEEDKVIFQKKIDEIAKTLGVVNGFEMESMQQVSYFSLLAKDEVPLLLSFLEKLEIHCREANDLKEACYMVVRKTNAFLESI